MLSKGNWVYSVLHGLCILCHNCTMGKLFIRVSLESTTTQTETFYLLQVYSVTDIGVPVRLDE
jgi:hypothetical protein